MPTATPYSAVNKDSYEMKKTWVLYSSLIPSSGSGKPVSEDKQPVSPRQEILYTSTAHPKHIQLLYMQRWRP